MVPAPCVAAPVARSDTTEIIASEGMVSASSSPSSAATIAELAAPTCFKPEQDTSFPIAGITTVALLQDSISELRVEPPGALHCSSSPITIILETQVPEVPVMFSTASTTEVGVLPAAKEVPPAMEEVLQSDQVQAVRAVQSQLIFADHMIDRLLSSSWQQEHMHCLTPWPPPYLYMSWFASSKPRPIPWPSFVVLPGGVHFTEPRPPVQGTSGEFPMVPVMQCFLDSQSWVRPLHICLHCELGREENFTSLQHNDRDDQFNSLSVSLNVLENFLKKQCTEPEEATVSGLISKGAVSVFKLWHIPWFSFLFLELISQEPYCLALFQWEIDWQPEAEGECFDSGVHYCHGNSFEDCPSAYMARVMLLYRNYCHLTYNHHICCWYALKTWSPLVRMGYIYWLLQIMQQQLKLFDISVFNGYNALGHVARSGFVLILWKIAWSLHWEHSEIASAEFNYNLLPDIIEANFVFLCYGAGGVATWSVFTTTFRPTGASALLDTMKRNNSKRSCRTLILTFLQVSDVIGFELWSQFGTMIMLVWSSQSMALLTGGKQGSNLYKLSSALLFTWQHVEYTKWSWDPGGCAFALCSSERTWPTPLHYHAHLLWSSLQFSGAFLIWLVAWTMDGLEFSMGLGQTPFQGGRRSSSKPEGAATSDQLNRCCRQWDPGGLLVASAWGQAEFQGGRGVRSLFLTYRYWHLDRPKPATWAWPGSDHQEQVTYTREEATQRSSGWGWIRTNGGGFFFSHLGSDSLSPFMLVLVSIYQILKQFM